jgi:hypothetical protein
MHFALRSRHSLMMHFVKLRVAGRNVEALDPIIELEQAKREMLLLSADGDSVVGGTNRCGAQMSPYSTDIAECPRGGPESRQTSRFQPQISTLDHDLDHDVRYLVV